VGIAAFQGTPESRLGTAEITALREDRTQVARCCRLSFLVGDAIDALRSRDVTAFLKQQAKVERAVWIAAFLRPAVRRLGAAEVAATLQQHAKVYRRGAVPPRVGVSVSVFSRGNVAPLLE